MAQLVQRPPGAHAEQFGGSPVRQPPPPAGRVQIEAGDGAGWPAVTQEDRSAGPAGQQAGEQLGRPGLPEHLLQRAALAVHPGPPVGQIQVLHVQGQEFVGAGGGLIQQPPQGSFPQVEIAVGKQPLQLTSGEGPGAVDPLAAPLQAIGRIEGEPSAAAPQPTAARRVASSRFQVAGAAAAWRPRNQPASVGPDRLPTAVAGPSSATRLASEAR